MNLYGDMCDKILKQIYSIIQDDPLLCEFSVIPTLLGDGDKNVTPVKYEAAVHCLGVESWCIQHVYKHAQEQILKLRRSYKKEGCLDVLSRCLDGALLIQPDVTTFWNIKRELFNAGLCKNIQHEFLLTKLIISHKSKAYSAFNYRCWLINKLNEPNFTTVINGELELLRIATQNTPNNYHACNHRIWCFDNLIVEYTPNKIYDELKYSEEWIGYHVSEHTGFHYRQHVLNHFKSKQLLHVEFINSLHQPFINVLDMIDSDYLSKFDDNALKYYEQYLKLLLHELYSVLKSLQVNFPGHEAIWYHRRYAFFSIYKTLAEIYALTNCRPAHIIDDRIPSDANFINDMSVTARMSDACVLVLAAPLYKQLVAHERAFLASLLDGCNNNVHDHALARKYMSWLRCILGVDL